MVAATYDKHWVETIRNDFPILSQEVNGYPLAYLDNAATTQKPQVVIDALQHYYSHDNANIHRGVHALSIRATLAFETVRDKVKRFIHAASSKECIFVKGTTEAINLVAQSYVAPNVGEADEILITHMEHHANIVPWQMVCHQTGAKLQVAAINLDGALVLEDFKRKLNSKTKFVAISYASNALGTVNPILEMVKLAHEVGAKVLVDGAQATAHFPIDVQALNCDFYVFSGHKMYAPTGVGVLWGRETLLDSMQPYQGGGDMIRQVTFESTEYAGLPHKFEAGTPNISGVIGLGVAIDYLQTLGHEKLIAQENFLLNYASESIKNIKGYSILGDVPQKVSVISFVHPKIHPHDIGTILDNEGIAVRSGHHCAMPLMDFFQVPATTRASFSFYNTKEEVDRLVEALIKVNDVFA